MRLMSLMSLMRLARPMRPFAEMLKACSDAATPHCIALSKNHQLSLQTLSKHSVVGLHRLIILNLEVDNVNGVFAARVFLDRLSALRTVRQLL